MHTYFKEEQKFNQFYVYTIIAVVMSISGYAIFELVASHEQADSEQIVAVSVSFLVAISVAVLFYFLKLQTRIDEVEIKVRFYPFINKKYKWSEVETAEVVEYRPLWEFGGWGIRYRVGKVAYSVRGKVALKLVLNTGRVVMIGTGKRAELEATITKITERNFSEG